MLRCAVGDVTAAADGGGRSLLGRQGQIGGTRLEGSGPARFVQFAAAAVGTSATSATRWCCCCGGGGFRVMMILIVFVCLWWILLRLLLLRRLFCVSFIATSDR